MGSRLRRSAMARRISSPDWARNEQHLVICEREPTALDRANMNAWRLDGDDAGSSGLVSMALPTSNKSGKRVFFGEDDDLEPVGRSSLPSGGEGSATRRKKVGWGSELVIEDDMGDLEGAKARKETPSERSEAKGTSSRSAKVSETVTANIVESVARPTAVSRVAAGGATSAQCDSDDADMEAFVHHLVRSHLLHHGHDDVVALLDSEKPCPALNASTFERFQQQVILSGLASFTTSETSLEQFLRSENSRLIGVSLRRASKETRESGKSKSSSGSSRRKKPVLNVVTKDDIVDDDNAAAADPGYNRLNHPGSTPRASADPTAAIIGEPGSTPMARAKDLAAFGFDDLDDIPSTPPQPSTQAAPSAVLRTDESELASSSSLEFSQYALTKRAANKHNKHVRIGEPGSTPTKEYVFFRETPPKFVTESVEAAVEVFASLGNDPTFRAPVIDKFVELQSSDVGKYRVGQRVENLGAQRNVSGVVTKVFGSRQCGSSGPGTIVIDTSPEDAQDQQEEQGESARGGGESDGRS